MRMPLPAAYRLAAFLFLIAAGLISCETKPAYRVEAVSQDLLVGAQSLIEVRIVDAMGSPVPASAIAVTSARLDMGPDKMAAMQALLARAPGTAPDRIAFTADNVTMAGRWALNLTLDVSGSAKPISARLIFVASERKAEGSSPPSAAARKVLYYRNPMGLADVSPTPKKDAMGMDYIPVYADEVAGVPGTVRLSPGKVQRAGVRSAPVGTRLLRRTIRAAGTVVDDESRVAVVTAKFDGFVDEMLVATVGQPVAAGQPLLRVWIESREILQKEADFLTALRTGSDLAYIRDARNNLRLFGVPADVIHELERTRRPVRSIVFASPIQGRVIEKPALRGLRFAAGDVLFKVVDRSVVWVMAQVPERDLGLVSTGQSARIVLTADQSAPIAGTVALVNPDIDSFTRTAMARILVANAGEQIKVGQYASVELDVSLASEPVLAVPAAAIIDSGARQVVLVAKEGGIFEPRSLMLGRRGDDWVEVRGGLAAGERIVVAGNFLIDAESNLNAALAAFGQAAAGQ